MRPIHTTLSLLLLLPPALAAGAPPAAEATASAATQALPPADLPEPVLVRLGELPAVPKPKAAGEPRLVLADTPDAPPIAEEIEKDSAELEAVREAEERAHVQEADGAAASGKIALLPELDVDLRSLQSRYDIPIEVNPAVVAYVRFFQSPAARGHFTKWLGRSHRYLERYREILREAGLPEDTVYLAMIESGFGNFAYSRARASGPWQFISSTGKHFGLKQDFWVDERRDPEKSARAAARYQKQLYEQTGDWRLAWAGYNAGVGRIYKAKKQGYDDFWEMAATPGRKVLRAETKGYVMAAAIISKQPEAFGFRAEEIQPQSWTEYEEVEIPNATLLTVAARAAGVSEKDLIDLNPELRRACTPPRPYRLKIPKASAETFAENWPAMRDRVRLTFAGHVVRRGDTLSGIAVRYGVPVQGIMEMNGIRSAHRLRPGTELLVPKPIGGAVARAEPVRHAGEERPAERRAVAAPEGTARTTHRVSQGDTLWSISQRFGVPLSDLCKWNGIKNPRRHTLQVGRTLVVFTDRG
jgi:membrane-bound lytic murein transglycosylase D